MAKVSPFHSKLPGTGVHHDNNKCTTGNNIETHNRSPPAPADCHGVATAAVSERSLTKASLPASRGRDSSLWAGA